MLNNILPELLDEVRLRGADVEVHLDEEGAVLVRLDLDGERRRVVEIRISRPFRGGPRDLGAEVDLSEAAHADRLAQLPALGAVGAPKDLSRRDRVRQLVAVGGRRRLPAPVGHGRRVLPREFGRHLAWKGMAVTPSAGNNYSTLIIITLKLKRLDLLIIYSLYHIEAFPKLRNI